MAYPDPNIVVSNTALGIGETSLVTFTFDQMISGFDNGDLTIANGTLTAVTTSDGLSYTATFTPDAGITDTTNLIVFDNSGVIDAGGVRAGDGFTESNNYVVDTVRPTAAIVLADSALAVGQTSLVTFTFSEAVTGFSNADLTIANGTLSGVTSGDGGITYTATLTPTAAMNDTTNVITLDNSGVTDLAGNAGTGTTDSGNYILDSVAPTATVVVADTALAAGQTSLVTIAFSEAVTGFTNADLAVANGSLSAVGSADGGITYTATFTPTASIADGTNLITLANTGIADLAGNAGSGTTDSNNYAIDTTRPTATVVVADASLKFGETSAVTVTFSEAVTGFTSADLTVANGVLTGFGSADGGVTWTATLTPSAGTTDATNLITLNNTGVTDQGGNTGLGGTDSNNYTIDTARPTAGIVVADASLTTGETSLVTFTFSEAVTGFTNADLTIANGALSAVATSDFGLTWTATFTPSVPVSDATNLITLANTGITDLAGNAGTGTTDSNNYTIVTVTPPVVPTPDPDPVPPATMPVITGTAGADVIVLTGAGASTVSAGAGNDMVQAGTGSDVLQGNQGADSISGGGAADTIHGGQDNDVLQGNVGADYMTGDSGADVVYGGQGSDFMQGNTGSDTISGDAGSDIVLGGQGDDRVSGGDGDDIVSGDLGNDTVNGGAGADTFQFNRSGGGADIIEDFSSSAHDVIRLTGFTSFADLAGRISTVGTETVITLDGGASIHLLGVTGASLTAGDFLFA